MMENIFLRLLNMSLTAAVLVVVVVLLRAVFHKAPRWLHCLLWVLVAVRLVCPFTIESDLSLMPSAPAVTVPERMEMSTPDTSLDLPSTEVILPDDPAASLPTDTPVSGTVTTPVTPTLPDSSVAAPGDSVDPWQVALAVATQVWLLGMLAMAAYAVFTTLRLRRQVGEAARVEGNIWQCDHIRTPFILGVFRPRIYLPSDLTAAARDSVVAHEKAHLHRLDHFWKPLGFLLLMVYWFNPILWVAYILLCRDIEAACDERVIRHMSAADRKAYSEALLCCSAPRRLISACPLAFGETGVKSRIKSVLSYKKPTIWIIVAALLVSTVAGVCLLTDRPVAEQEPDDPPAVTDEGEAPKYATFLHTGEPKAQVQLELDGDGCIYTHSILSSWQAEGTYTMGESSVTLSFPDSTMTVKFDGDFTGLTFRMSGSRMSYEQVSFGDVELKNGAVFERVADTRAVSFATPHTIFSINWMTQEKRTAMRQQYSYRTGNNANKDLSVIPITSRVELDAFVAEYGSEMPFPALSYDDAFFADKMLAAVYYTNTSCSVKPQIAAVEYNGAELVTLQVDVYEPGALDDGLGQWFMLAEIPRSEIPYATRFRAVKRHLIPTDNYFATYSHPITVGDTEPTMGWSRLGESATKYRQLVDRLTWYGADVMADTAFTALGYFTFDGEKKYYVSPDGKQLYDGEQIADLTADDAVWVSYPFREGVPVDAATASVTGMVVEWSKEGGYLVLDVTDGDSKLGERVRAYTSILAPGSAPAVGYAATLYYDGWYLSEGDYSVIYALDRKWMDADLLGGPDDDEPTTTTPPTTTTAPSATTPPTSAPTTTQTATPTARAAAEVGAVYIAGGLGEWKDEVLQEVYGDLPESSLPIKAFTSYDALDTFLSAYASDNGKIKRADFAAFDAAWFAENALLMTYYVHPTATPDPKVESYVYTEDGAVLTVRLHIYVPLMDGEAVSAWHIFSGIRKADLDGVKTLTAVVAATIPDEYYVSAIERTEHPETASEKWRRWLPSEEGWELEKLLNEWDETGRWGDSQSVDRAFEFAFVFNLHGHTHYLATDFSALLRDDGTLLWLTEEEANLIKRIIAIAEQQ